MIDWHAHWIPVQLADALRRRAAAPRVVRTQDQDWLETWAGTLPLSRLVDESTRLDTMARHGIAGQVLSLPGLFGIDSLPADEALPLVRLFNDACADKLSRDPDRFAAIAALPVTDTRLACDELRRARRMGLIGAILPADAFVSLDAAREWRIVLQTANALECHIFIHPGPVASYPEAALDDRGDNAWQRWIVLHTQSVLSSVVFTLNLTNYLDAFPAVTVQIANLGGFVPFVVDRMDAVQRSRNREALVPSRRLTRCYVDTASLGASSIAAAAAAFGSRRVLFGSDYPIFDTTDAIAAFRNALCEMPAGFALERTSVSLGPD